jgi:hypothetical protein
MIKLLVTAITWAMFSTGLVAVPNHLVTTDPDMTTEAPKLVTDTYCEKGNWPDRERACSADSRPSLLTKKPQAVEKPADIERIEARVAAPLTFQGGVRFYDASRIADAPVQAEPTATASYELSGTTVTVPAPAPLAQTAQLTPPASITDQDRIERIERPAARKQAPSMYRPAHTRRSSEARRHVASNTPRPSLSRVYGLAF